MKLINNKFNGFHSIKLMFLRNNYSTVRDLQDLCGTHLELSDVGLIIPELDLQLRSLLLVLQLFPGGAVSLHQ